jgi:hypothetical protein
VALFLPVAARAGEAELISQVQDVAGATAARYGAVDNRGFPLEALKIINNPKGGYLGVYQTTVEGINYVKVGTSTDLLAWTTRTMLASHGSQPTIARLTDGGFLVAYEQDGGCKGAGAPGGSCLRLLHYPTLLALLNHISDRSFLIKRTTSACAEGSPNIYATHLGPDLSHSTIRLGFHYSRDCRFDRQAIGTVTNFTSWQKEIPQPPNQTVQALGAVGDITDRDAIYYDGVQYRLVDGQLVHGDQSSWRTFLYSVPFGAKKLDLRTHRGSTAFENPTTTWVTAPGGGQAIVFTQTIPAAGAAPGEAGELIYYKVVPPKDPVIAAAGDIACEPTSASFNGGLGTANACRQKYTADVISSLGPIAGVLPLGDDQYEQGALSQYLGSYDLSWGRFSGLTYPAIGNHEYGTPGAAGYFDYFNGAGVLNGAAGERGKAYYSYDIGTWHLIALNSNCTQAGGCRAGSPQEIWLKADLAAHPAACTVAYWHHPRFSSGQHGDTALTEPLWQDLYDANADLVLVGHDHLYERFGPQTSTGVADPVRGLREFIVGTGGRSHYGFAAPKPNSEVRNSDTFGVLKLTLHPSSYDWRFVPEAGGTFTDSGSTACH